MRIAINCRFLLPGRLEGFGWYTFELLKALARQHPEDDFLCLFDRPADPAFLTEPNMQAVVLGPQARHPILFYCWFEWSVTRALKQYKADVFFSPDGFLSLRSKVPTLLAIHDLAYLSYPGAIDWMNRWNYRYFMPRFIRRADRIVTVSRFVQADLLRHFPGAAAKTSVVYNGLREGFSRTSPEEQEEVRGRISGGKPYFFYLGAIHPRKNVDGLIKAFGLFKARSGSEVQLVIAGRLAWQSGPVDTALKSARFREDIHFTGPLDQSELQQLTGAALAVTYLSLFEGFGLPVIEAMQAGVPVLTSSDSAMEEVAADAALLADPRDLDSMARGMERMWRDPELRQELIKKGLQRVRIFSWEEAARELYRLLAGLHKTSR